MSGKEKFRERIDLPYAPDIPGLAFRSFRGKSDYQIILDLINACKEADQIERTDSLEDIAREIEHLNNFDPFRDVFFAEIKGQPAAFGRVQWYLDEEGRWLGAHLGFLHPDWRRKGVGTAMLRYQEDHLRRVSQVLIDEGQISVDTPRFFDASASDTEVSKETLLKKAAYKPVRFYYSMVRPLSEPIEITPMPEGLEIRKVHPDQLRLVWEADQEAFQDHWGYIEGTEMDYKRWLNDPLNDPDLWKVAWDGGQVAGMVLNFLDQNENEEFNRLWGWTEDISVRRPWRRCGLARALLTRSLQMFKDMGMDHAALDVDTNNLTGALDLYESVGFKVHKRHTEYWKRL